MDSTSNNNSNNDTMSKEDLCRMMADIDAEFNQNDTAEMWNARLRYKIAHNFNKMCLTNEQVQLFGVWKYLVETNLNDYASRYDIFMQAPESCLYVVGL